MAVTTGNEKQIRIGLVLYGGVSLTIYIYGVVLEFLRAIRARIDSDDVYKEFLEVKKTEIIVDIMHDIG